MSEKENTPAQEQTDLAQTLPTIGGLLRQAREEAGLTVADIAGHLKLSLPQLHALENDDFERLHGPVFVRGFARNYARYLHVDEAQMQAALDRQLPRAKPTESVSETHTSFTTGDSRPLPWRLIGAGAVALLVVVLAGWWIRGGSGDGRSESAATDQNPDALAPMMTEQTASESAAASMPTALVASGTAASASAPSVAVAPGQGNIWLKTNAPVWLSVYDADGKKLLNGTLAAGEQRTVFGKTPLRVRIHNVSRLEMRYNNQPVDLKTYQRGESQRVRFELK